MHWHYFFGVANGITMSCRFGCLYGPMSSLVNLMSMALFQLFLSLPCFHKYLGPYFIKLYWQCPNIVTFYWKLYLGHFAEKAERFYKIMSNFKPLDGSTIPGISCSVCLYVQLLFKDQNVPAFNRDKCCPLQLVFHQWESTALCNKNILIEGNSVRL
jgi:hypothetical protein